MLIFSLTTFKQEYSKGKFFKTLKAQNLFKKKGLNQFFLFAFFQELCQLSKYKNLEDLVVFSAKNECKGKPRTNTFCLEMFETTINKSGVTQ